MSTITTTDIRQTPFVKQLAANDRPTREAALASLRTYLSAARDLTPTDHLKLWKGLFYCLWLTDRPRPQAQLCDGLAALPDLLPAAAAPAFLRAFWATMAREWTGIDVLRMEKFLLLVRRVVGASFALARGAGAWAGGAARRAAAVLAEGPLVVGDVRAPMGLRYHVMDVYVDELERAGALEAEAGPAREILLAPLRRLAADSPTKMVRVRAKEVLEDERLPGIQENPREGAEEDQAVGDAEDDEWEGIAD